MTMLTLFKPWRTGKDLRLHENITWDDTFADYTFTERQKEIMKFFHIRYECNDARDDFSSQRRQAEKGGRTLFNMSSEEMDEMDTQAYIFDGGSYQEDREHEIVNDASWSNVSGGELLRQARMTQAENIMR